MIDLHNHILWGVDDGAADLDESLDIARQFVSEGVTRVAATPHLDPERGTGLPASDVHVRTADLQAAIRAADIPLTVVPGNELYLTPDAPDLLGSGTVATLGGSRAVLVEVSLLSAQRPFYLDDVLFRIQLAGYQPVFAHPERYPFVQRDVQSLDGVRDRGIALQLTAPALLGEYGGGIRRTAETLLRRGVYTLAASDRHHPGAMRSLALLRAKIEEMVGEETADLLLRVNPERLLSGKSVIDPPVTDVEEPGFLGRIFRRL